MKNNETYVNNMTEMNEADICLMPEAVPEETVYEEKADVFSEERPKKAVRVNEIEELREENQKVFRMSDGTEQAVFYSRQVDESDREEGILPAAMNLETENSGSTVMTTYSWNNGIMSRSTLHGVGIQGSGDGDCHVKRMYINLSLPVLPRNPRIKKAELEFFQLEGGIESSNTPLFGLYQVQDAIVTGSCTPKTLKLLDYGIMKAGTGENGKKISYTFDVTKLVDEVSKGEVSCGNMVVKLQDESYIANDQIVLYGSDYGDNYGPRLLVTYESGYGVNTSYRTHTHELGRFGQGSIDLACGNLMLESEDFSWGGNRMPVTLKHLYNSALADYQYTGNESICLHAADFSGMKVGHGFRLNLMQSMVPVSFQQEGTAYSGYVYVGENGEETYFKPSSREDEPNRYEEAEGGGMIYDAQKRTMISGSDSYTFDSSGRLVMVTDEKGNNMTMAYTSGKMTAVTDGAGRVFAFSYDEAGFLSSVEAPDGTKILYTYADNRLSAVTYPNGRKAEIQYTAHKPSRIILKDGNKEVYKTEYAYSGDRVISVTEYGVENGLFVMGASTQYAYSAASRSTTVTTTQPQDEGDTENQEIKTVYTFGEDGNIVSQYAYSQDMGHVGVNGGDSGIRPYSGDGGVVSNINNLLVRHNFGTLNGWTGMETNCGDMGISSETDESQARFGRSWLKLQSRREGDIKNGVYQLTNQLPGGAYTFSVYVRILEAFAGTAKPGAYLRVTTTEGTILGESEHIAACDTEYIRLTAPFHLTSEQSVKVQILVDGKGTAQVNGAQLESNAFANAYNMLENGNFERGTAEWSCTAGVTDSVTAKFDMSRSLYMAGALASVRSACQKVAVKVGRSTRETFTLSGWAKGKGLIGREREGANPPQFRLRALVKYYDPKYKEYGSEEYTADFAPCTEEWQFASLQFAKGKFRTVEEIRVYCDYSYNYGGAYFDNIQLIRDGIETDLSPEDFITEDTGEPEETNGLSAAEGAEAFAEAADSFGNILTETTFTDGEFGSIYRSFGFNADNGQLAGNNLIRETDARGNETSYTVDSQTSRNEEVTDRMGNKTVYEYDASGRTTKVTSKKADGTAIANVSYAYDTFDNMTEIARGDGMKYEFEYDAFHNLESIGVKGKTDKLIRYDYKNGNSRLKAITYANGDTMKATYNSVGQMTAEKWYNAANTLTAHYKYVYDGQGNIVRSIDILAKIEYNYTYDNGRIIRVAESKITLSGEVVTAKKLINSILYSYDSEGKLIKKHIIPVVGSEQVIYYETNDDNTVVKFKAGGKTVTSHSKTDSFGRKVFDELQLGTGFVSRQFHYHSGEVTGEHVADEKLKSSATTQLVSQIVLSGGRTISYEYDAEERITKVTDSVDGVTEYTYDALGQLLTEIVYGVAKNTMIYDNYGNIKSKNGVAYTYGDGTWKDLLTKVGDKTISYDKQGNPVSYLGHTLIWEKGRQLKSFDGNTYTYNANGIRTSKTVNGVKHTYTLDGTKILQETWGNNTLVPLYDNEDSVCGITYNNEPFYFQKNLQGDIVGIVDRDAKVIAKYFYDAWGACTVTSDTSEVGVATINPFRYRGYYYDSEIEMYYIQSRYYNSFVGGFLNTDEARMLLLNNDYARLSLFCYCMNSPINYTDVAGKIAITISLSAIAAYNLAKLLLALVLLWITTAILLDPGFQRALADAIDALGTGIKSLSNAVTKAIDEALSKAKKKSRNNRYERHHIVAQAASNWHASESRNILRNVGIGINSSYNLVDIKYNLHRYLHTNVYYKSVYNFLNRARGSYRKVVLVLNVIKKALQAASKVCP